MHWLTELNANECGGMNTYNQLYHELRIRNQRLISPLTELLVKTDRMSMPIPKPIEVYMFQGIPQTDSLNISPCDVMFLD